VTQVSQSPFPDDLIVNDRVPPVLPGSPGRAHSIFSNTSSNRHRISMRLWPFRSREPRLDPLPDNLTFTFSATGESVLLWRLNGNSLVRIQVKDRTSCSLPLRTALQAYDGDKTVTIKSAHEGKEWIAIILDNKQACSENSIAPVLTLSSGIDFWSHIVQELTILCYLYPHTKSLWCFKCPAMMHT
jgi:hypothetical protein